MDALNQLHIVIFCFGEADDNDQSDIESFVQLNLLLLFLQFFDLFFQPYLNHVFLLRKKHWYTLFQCFYFCILLSTDHLILTSKVNFIIPLRIGFVNRNFSTIFVLFGKKKSLHSEKKLRCRDFFCVHLNFQEGVRFFDPFFDCIYDGEPFWVTTKFRYGRKLK